MQTDDQPTDSLTGFIRSLSTGAMIQVTIAGRAPENAEDLASAKELLIEVDAIARLHAPSSAPQLNIESSLWAARVMRYCCRMLVDRVETQTDLPKSLAEQPSLDSAQNHWSIDLIFRSWWDLVSRAKKLSSNDPLNQTIDSVTRNWPLAAVGTNTNFDTSQLDTIWNHDCLRRLLVDRIVRRQDKELIKDERFANAVQRVNELSRS